MFGYLRPSYKAMSNQCKKQYRSFYCGLCHALSDTYHLKGLCSLNYEVTGFLILVHGLMDHQSRTYWGSCSLTPFVWSQYIDYTCDTLRRASDISVLMIKYELEDNLQDGDRKAFNFSSLIMRQFSNGVPDNLKCLQVNTQKKLQEFYAEEGSKDASFQNLVHKCGLLAKYLFEPLIDYCEATDKEHVSNIAYLLGKWIYLMDACDDFREDQKKNKPNPLFLDDAPLHRIDVVMEEIEQRIQEHIHALLFSQYDELIQFLFGENMRRIRKKILDSFPVPIEQNSDAD